MYYRHNQITGIDLILYMNTCRMDNEVLKHNLYTHLRTIAINNYHSYSDNNYFYYFWYYITEFLKWRDVTAEYVYTFIIIELVYLSQCKEIPYSGINKN